MEARLKIKMDREINPKYHYISPGGYAVKLKNNSVIQFNFLDYAGNINQYNRTILKCKLSHPDVSAFPDMRALCQNMLNIVAIDNFFIYTGEIDDPNHIEYIKPEKILEFVIIDDNYYSTKYKVETTKFIETDIRNTSVHFSFTKELLDRISYDPVGNFIFT